MFFDILYTIIISLLIIYVIHYLYEFFKTNLTTPKIKDLIVKPKQEYEKIYELISNPTTPNSANTPTYANTSNSTNTSNTTNTPNNSDIDTNLIKNELKNFFDDLNNTNSNQNNTTPIINNINDFSFETNTLSNF